MKKKHQLIGLIILLFLLIVAIIPFSFQYSFKTQQNPYSVLTEMEGVLNISEQKGVLHFKQTPLNLSHVEIAWELKPLENGTSIQSQFIYTKNKFLNNLKFWFGINDDFKTFKTLNLEVRKKLNNLSTLFSLGNIAEDTYQIKSCICKSFTSKVKEKANLMNKHIDILAKYLPANKKSAPFVRIKSLDFINDVLMFDFCFKIPDNYTPSIIENDIFVSHFNENFSKSKGFIGNYSYTYHNWATFFSNKTNVVFPMVETYLNNPFSGSDDKKWVSKIFYN